MDSQKDALDLDKDGSGAAKDGIAQMKDGLDAMSALREKAQEDLTTETGKIKDQLANLQAEADTLKATVEQLSSTVSATQESMEIHLEEAFNKSMEDASVMSKLWDQLKEYAAHNVREVILDTLTQDFIEKLLGENPDEIKNEIEKIKTDIEEIKTEVRAGVKN